MLERWRSHGLLADRRASGDLLGAIALGDQLDDFLLTGSERLLPQVQIVARGAEVIAGSTRSWHRDRGTPHRVLSLAHVRSQLGRDAGLDPKEIQQHRGQRLANLVVQLSGDPQPLGLLRGEHSSGRLTPLESISLKVNGEFPHLRGR
jgi:hypothetical protein